MSDASQRIENPKEPRHFARLKPVGRTIRVMRAGRLLAESREAIRLLEHGRDLYDPVLYIPLSDLAATLSERQERTHCPLKGDARYYDLLDAAGARDVEKIAWAYPEPFDFAAALAGHVAFDADQVTISEGDR